MNGQQGYIYQANSHLLGADIMAAVKPSDKQPLIFSVNKAGYGGIRTKGKYRGQYDGKYEVVITDTNNPSKPLASSPIFSGIGTGTIKDINCFASMQTPKTISITCQDVGVKPRHASIEIAGLTFIAKESGTEGNNIQIEISNNDIILADTGYQLIDNVKSGTDSYTDISMNFDAMPIQSASFIMFENDPLNIYFHYSGAANGVNSYHFQPALQRNYPKATKIYKLTRGRTLTVRANNNIETYTNIITVADMWQAIKKSRILTTLDTSIDLSRKAGALSTTPLNILTDAYAISVNDTVQVKDIEIASTIATQGINIECTQADFPGREQWKVNSSRLGILGTAQTGTRADFNDVSFLIPNTYNQTSKASIKWKINAKTDFDFSAACGASASEKNITLTYKKTQNIASYKFQLECLGLTDDTQQGGEEDMIMPDLLFWTNATIRRMIEEIANRSDYEQEAGSTMAGNLKRETSFMIELCSRIMNLPAGDNAKKDMFVQQYRSLLEGISLLYQYTWGVTHNIVIKWNGNIWVDGNNNEFKLDKHSIPNASSFTLNDITYDTILYKELVDEIIDYEVLYQKKNITTNCYSEVSNDEYFWEVESDRSYLHAYTDIPYYSSVKSGDNIINTKEFAFMISAPSGGSTFAEGDSIVLTITGGAKRQYKVGDVARIDVYDRMDLSLSGGIAGNDICLFSVSDSSSVKYPNHVLNRNNPMPYVNSKFSFFIEEGYIPFEVGDTFSFNIEGGHYIWRKEHGEWSEPISIKEECKELSDGILISFHAGYFPSFVSGDKYEIHAVQENSPVNMVSLAKHLAWRGTGDIVFDLNANKSIDTILIDQHNLTGNISIIAATDHEFSDVVLDIVLPSSQLIFRLLQTPIAARYVKIIAEAAEDIAVIGYCFIGKIMTIGHDADSVTHGRSYAYNRQDNVSSKDPLAICKFSQKTYKVNYDSFIFNDDFEKLDKMIEYLKKNNDMPFYFVANLTSNTCTRVRIDGDSHDYSNVIDLNAPESKRLYKLNLSLSEA